MTVQHTVRTTKLVQTHNADSIALSAFKTSGGYQTPNDWISADGFDRVEFTLLNDGSTNNSLDVIWSTDAVSTHGKETVIANGGNPTRTGGTFVRAPWFKVVVTNGDGAGAHIMSAWAYLKS